MCGTYVKEVIKVYIGNKTVICDIILLPQPEHFGNVREQISDKTPVTCARYFMNEAM